jgi:hypothetical protein
MKGDKGTCTAGSGKDLINRTKYDTQKHAQEARDFHVGMKFSPDDYITYHCKLCGMWHFGKPEWAKKYEK